jgi:hypothetical protein
MDLGSKGEMKKAIFRELSAAETLSTEQIL